MEGAMNTGRVDFESLDDNRTRLYLRLNYEPQGLLEKTGDALGFVTAKVKGDLQRFKEFIENIPGPRDGWRGEILGRHVHEVE